MEVNFIDIKFEGSKFSPKTLMNLTKLPLEVLAEYGEIASRGRYKGKKSPYGLALLKVEPKNNFENLEDALRKVVKKLISHKKHLAECNVEEISVDVENNSSYKLEKDIIKDLSKLNANIDINPIEEIGASLVYKHHPSGASSVYKHPSVEFFETEKPIYFTNSKIDEVFKNIFIHSKKIFETRNVSNVQAILFTRYYIELYLSKTSEEPLPIEEAFEKYLSE
jgi:hypothetical protein